MYRNVMNCFRSVTDRSLIKTNALSYVTELKSFHKNFRLKLKEEVNCALHFIILTQTNKQTNNLLTDRLTDLMTYQLNKYLDD